MTPADPFPRCTPLRRADLDPDPFVQFDRWYTEVLRSALPEPTAMTLATADPSGQPSARVVLLKGFSEHGFLFFTNYSSRKGRELEANPRAAFVFFWAPFARQVRATGTVEKASREESEHYFRTRPLGSRLGAWASEQSQPIPDRAFLEERVEALQLKYGDAVPLPPFWGGYRLVPAEIEFWQGREDRLHDRFVYRREDAREWKIQRLAP